MSAASRPRPGRAAVAGVLFGLAGVASYFVVVFRFGAWLPEVRNSAGPNWALVVGGLGLSALAVRRARETPPGSPGRRLAPALAAVNVVLAAGFAWILYGLPALPVVAGPALGAPAPDFVLADQDGRTVHLADFRGQPLLLVFYRGHW